MNAFALSGLLTTLSSFAMGFFVLWMNPQRPLNRTWCLFTVAIAGWGLTALGVGLSTDRTTTLWIWRVGFATSVVWIPICFYHFVTILCDLKRPIAVRVHYACGAVMVPILLLSPLFISGVRPVFDMDWIIPGPLYGVWSAWWFTLIIYGHYRLFTAYQRARGLKRNQYRYVLFGVGFTCLTGALCFLPTFGIELYPYGSFGICIYPIVMALAIVKYRTLDITIVLERSLAYLLLCLMSTIPAMLILLGAQWVYFGHMHPTFSLLTFALFSLLIFGAYHVKQVAETTIARTMFPARQERHDMLFAFSKTLSSVQDLTTLAETMVARLTEAFHPQAVSLYVLEDETNAYVRIAGQGRLSRTRPSVSHVSAQYLTRHHTILLRSDVDDQKASPAKRELLSILDPESTEVSIPLLIQDALIGFCNLGARQNDTVYSDEDLKLLSILADQAAIGLHNAMLYHKLKRSEQLLQRTERLRSVQTLAAGFAHEIRNPLVSIHTFVQLVLSDHQIPSRLAELSSAVQDDFRRINRLVRDILQYAKHRPPELRATDLNALISDCVRLLTLQVPPNSLTLSTQLDSDLPGLTLDPHQMKQVLMNLLINATEAMHNTHGALTIRTRARTLPNEELWICIDIIDTGMGIDPETLTHIFDPFYTTKQDSTERVGTGLGLTIANQIVHDHHGYIEVTSAVGQGTRASINLPVTPLVMALGTPQA